MLQPMLHRLAASTLVLAASLAQANEAEIRKVLSERFPTIPRIDEVSKGPMPGLWEVRLGNEVMYTDDKAQFLIQGEIIDTGSRRNLTQERIDKLTAIDFASLPLKDAIV